MYYRLLFLSFFIYTIASGMKHDVISVHKDPKFFRPYSRVPSLRALAAQKVQELGLVRNITEQNILDDVFVTECRHMPEQIVEKHRNEMLTRIQRNNSIAPCNGRVRERIYTYNALEYMNKKVR